jgi:ParB family chromosome partitioning protein
LRLPESVKVMVREGALSAGHARTLIGAEDAEARARQIVDAALNVRQAEQRSSNQKKPSSNKALEKDADTAALERDLTQRLGLAVNVHHRGDKGGELRVSYKTLEQLDEIVRRLGRT